MNHSTKSLKSCQWWLKYVLYVCKVRTLTSECMSYHFQSYENVLVLHVSTSPESTIACFFLHDMTVFYFILSPYTSLVLPKTTSSEIRWDIICFMFAVFHCLHSGCIPCISSTCPLVLIRVWFSVVHVYCNLMTDDSIWLTSSMSSACGPCHATGNYYYYHYYFYYYIILLND